MPHACCVNAPDVDAALVTAGIADHPCTHVAYRTGMQNVWNVWNGWGQPCHWCVGVPCYRMERSDKQGMQSQFKVNYPVYHF